MDGSAVFGDLFFHNASVYLATGRQRFQVYSFLGYPSQGRVISKFLRHFHDVHLQAVLFKWPSLTFPTKNRKMRVFTEISSRVAGFVSLGVESKPEKESSIPGQVSDGSKCDQTMVTLRFFPMTSQS